MLTNHYEFVLFYHRSKRSSKKSTPPTYDETPNVESTRSRERKSKSRGDKPTSAVDDKSRRSTEEPTYDEPLDEESTQPRERRSKSSGERDSTRRSSSKKATTPSPEPMQPRERRPPEDDISTSPTKKSRPSSKKSTSADDSTERSPTSPTIDSAKKKKKRKYADICKKDGKPGYVLDIALPIYNKTIKMATKELHMMVCKCINDLEAGRERKIKYFFISKIFLSQNEKYNAFDPTLKLTGIPEGCEKLFEESYGQDGMIVLATVTNDSIPDNCSNNWYIRGPEEYAQILEKRIIDIFVEREDQRLVNGTTELLEKMGSIPKVYLIFMTFTMEGMYDVFYNGATHINNNVWRHYTQLY